VLRVLPGGGHGDKARAAGMPVTVSLVLARSAIGCTTAEWLCTPLAGMERN